MKVQISSLSPEPGIGAGRAIFFAAGPAGEVAQGLYSIEPHRLQEAVIDQLRDGDVIVGSDETGMVSTMHLSFRKRLVEMHDGFRTPHAQTLLRDLGWEFCET